ncbi:MAG: hypothetical protein DRI75_03595 [Bacteroidetes bacterium]|nr:MAG: hypothetical protein DRI75_03595 [Bacteroidota bacterium]
MRKHLFSGFLAIFILLAICSCKSEPIETIAFIETPAGLISSEPNLHKTDDGTIYLSWIETNADKSSTLSFSTLDDNNSWSQPKTIANGTDWFVNWADFPSISSFGKIGLAAHFLDKSAEDTFAYDVKLTLSNDNGNTWNAPFIPHSDNTKTEHGFVSKVAMNDNSFLAVWLDGRKMAYAEKDSTITKEMTLRSAIINKEGELLNEYLLDNRVCDCCQTDAAMTNDGPIVVYRDRSEKEIRDIYYVRLINNEWTEPKPIFNDNWEIVGCPVNGAAISAKDNTVAVVWFTMAFNVPKVKVAFSNDNGETFGKPINIGDIDPMGRVDIELLEDNSAFVSWMDIVNENTVIQLQKVFQDGTLSELTTLTESSESRSSGFPRMVVKDNMAYLTWTDARDKNLSIKTARVNTNNLR